MDKRNFTLTINPEDGTPAKAISSLDPDLLAIVGRQHHAAAKNKPLLTISEPDGTPLLVMDQWATTWRSPTPEEFATAPE